MSQTQELAVDGALLALVPGELDEAYRTNARKLDGHLPALDGIRGLAVLLVLFTDFTENHQPHTRLVAFILKFLTAGWWGVNLFFVLSGFLITGILLRTRSEPHYFRNFYMRRGLRVFPLYFAMMIATLLIAPLLVPDHSPTQNELLSRQGWLWTYTSNIPIGLHNDWWYFKGAHFSYGHTWSLAVEEHFYLCWPILVLLCRPRRLVQVCCALFVCSFVGRAIFLLVAHKSVAAFVLTPCRVDGLALGALLAVGLRYYPQTWQWRRIARVVLDVTLAIFLGMLLTRHLFSSRDPFIGTVGVTALDWLSASLVFLAVTATPGQLAGRIFSLTLLRRFGKYSYSIYLLHPIIHGIYRAGFGVPKLMAWGGSELAAIMIHGLLATCCAYFAAVITWNLYEKHFLAMKRWFESPRPTRD